jgi:hypothetical protein
MIWQLMKRDRTWKVATAIMGSMFVGATFGLETAALKFDLFANPSFRPAVPFAFAFIAGFSAWFVVALAFTIQNQSALYEAVLPIAGRDLWLARVLSLLAMVWLPVFIAMLIGIALRFAPLLPLLQVSAIFTVLILAAKCVRIRAIGAPPWLSLAGVLSPFLVMFVAPSVIKHLKSAGWFVLPPTGIVLTICGLASVALFAWGWVTVPKSFQIATAESRLDLRSQTKEQSSLTWAPVLQCIYGRPTLFLLGGIFFGQLWSASLLIGLTHAQIRGQCRWLLALPISPRKLFGWIAMPLTAAAILACLAGIFIDTRHPLSPPARLVKIAAELAVLYGLIFLSELSLWRRLSKVRATRWGVQILWTPFIIGAIAPGFFLPNTEAIQRLAGVLPGTWWQLACILAIPVIATYWLAEKAFREQEYRPSLILGR